MGRRWRRDSSEVNDSPSLQVRNMAITQQSTTKGVRVRGGDKARITVLVATLVAGGSSASCVFCSDEEK